MNLLQIIIALLVVGGLLYLLNFVPVDNVIKQVIRVVAIIVLAIIILRAVWPMTGLG